MIIAATGHRLGPKVGGYDVKTRLALGALAVEYLHQTRPDKVIVGMAIGWDQAMAAACVALDIPFIAAVPFPGQASRWPADSQDRWRRLLDQAESVHYICRSKQILSGRQINDFMRYRNQWMVDNAEAVVALWDGNIGSGTASTVFYAETRGKPVTNLWSRWMGQVVDPFDAMLG